MFDDKAALVGAVGEGVQGLCFDSRGDDGAEVFVRAADGHGPFDLKPEDTTRTGFVELDDKVVHGVAMALLLHSDAGDDARLASGALAAQEVRKIIGTYGVFIGEARATGQFSRCCFVVR